MAYNRADIIAAARSYLGVRFKYKGRTRHEGIDCVGLLVMISRDIGHPIVDDTTYGKHPDPEMFRKIITDQTKAGSISALRTGMIGMFRQTIYPLHTGIIVISGPTISVINASMKQRKVVEEPWTTWRNDLLAVREFPGV